jgi:hypothetical protein
VNRRVEHTNPSSLRGRTYRRRCSEVAFIQECCRVHGRPGAALPCGASAVGKNWLRIRGRLRGSCGVRQAQTDASENTRTAASLSTTRNRAQRYIGKLAEYAVKENIVTLVFKGERAYSDSISIEAERLWMNKADAASVRPVNASTFSGSLLVVFLTSKAVKPASGV